MGLQENKDSDMRLGLHTYSLYMHGIGQAWGGFQLPWERQLTTFELLDKGVEWGLDGFHIDDGVLETLDRNFLGEVKTAAREKHLYLEYNMSLDLGGFGIGIENDMESGLYTADALGADVLKIGMDLKRPRPRAGSRFHPKVMPYLKDTVEQFKKNAPLAKNLNIKMALENHCDTFSEEVLWVINEVDHPHVGACMDTVNAWHMTEDPARAIENLAPAAFTNHFRDDRVEYCRDGFKVSGVAVGDGDIDMKSAYELIKLKSPTNRVNIETEMGFPLDDRDTTLRLEVQTIQKSINYCRKVLHVGQQDTEG